MNVHTDRLAALNPTVNSPAKFSAAYNGHMDRIKILRALIDAKHHGNVAAFSRAIKKAPAQVHQWLSGHRNLGDAGARNIEMKLNLGLGYFDGHGTQPRTPVEHNIVKEDSVAYLANERKDHTSTHCSHILAWDSLDDLPDKSAYVTVPHHDVHLSAGDGADAQWLEHADSVPLVFHTRFFQARGIQPGRCRALYVRGASMEPTLNDGDTVLIDTARTQVEDDAIFAVLYHGELYIKRLFRLPGGGLELRSDNERHPTREIHGEDINRMIILGRMIWRAG